MNSKQRSKLRSLAHHRKPIVVIGKDGLTKGAISSINRALDVHELIKVKFSQNKYSKEVLVKSSEDILSAFIIGDVGHTIIIFRAQKDRDRRKYNI